MKKQIAVSVLDKRLAPVFDVSQNVRIFEIEENGTRLIGNLSFKDRDIFSRARMLAEEKVDLLVCGAISYYSEKILNSSGVDVLPFICGEVDEVVDALARDNLTENRFRMPGCQMRKRRGHCRGRFRNMEDI
jgi:predicted Fe-Mo cluster-binding NifX family protein